MNRVWHAFTLVEVLVYLGLFSVIVGGAAVSAESLMESSERGATESMLQEEGDFLIAKIDWALSGAKRFDEPTVGMTGTDLSVSKWVPTSGGNPIQFFLSGSALHITEGTATTETLNNANVSVGAFVVTHTYVGGVNPESVSVSFALSAKTPHGMSVSKTFSTVAYIRK